MRTLEATLAGGASRRVRRFFHELSPESHRRRFFSLCDPTESLIEAFCHSSHPTRQATMVALRPIDGELRPITVGSYLRIGTAAANEFSQFEATVLAEHNAMLEVFRDSGFEVRSTMERGTVTVFLSLPVS